MKRNDKIISDLVDPTGFTVENNPHPYPLEADALGGGAGYDWKAYFEWDKDGIEPIKCHMCLKRAEVGSGNCRDGSDYFICLPKDVREGKRPYIPPRRTKQSKLF